VGGETRKKLRAPKGEMGVVHKKKERGEKEAEGILKNCALRRSAQS